MEHGSHFGNPGPGCHFGQINTKRCMTLLVAGFSVMPIIDTDNGQIGRVYQPNRGQRPHVHEQLAIASQYQHPTLRLRQRQAQAHGNRPAHDTGTCIVVGVGLAEMSGVLSSTRQTGNHEKIVRVPHQLRHGVTAIQTA